MKTKLFIIIILVEVSTTKVLPQDNSFQIGYNLIDPLTSSFTNHELGLKSQFFRHVGFNTHLGITTRGVGVICMIGHPYDKYSIIGIHSRIGADWYPLQLFCKTKQNLLIGSQYIISFSHEKAIDTSKQPNLPVHVNSYGHGIFLRAGGAFEISNHFGLEIAVNVIPIFERDKYLLARCATIQPGIPWGNIRFDFLVLYRIR